jgi:hypothetical protein
VSYGHNDPTAWGTDVPTDEGTDAPTDESTDAPTDESTADGTEDATEMDSAYPVGTLVYKQFDGEWWTGTIESSHNGEYAVRWSDDSVEVYDEGPEMDQMVSDAANIPSSGMKGVGKFFISVLVLVVVGVGAFFGIKMYQRKKQAELAVQNGSALDEPREDSIVSYRDDRIV